MERADTVTYLQSSLVFMTTLLRLPTICRPNPNLVNKWVTRGAGDGQFLDPWSVAVASDGSVYVADIFNNRIQKFTVGA